MAKKELWNDSQVCPSWVVWPFTEIGEVKEAVEVTAWTRQEFAAEEGQRRDCKESRSGVEIYCQCTPLPWRPCPGP